MLHFYLSTTNMAEAMFRAEWKHSDKLLAQKWANKLTGSGPVRVKRAVKRSEIYR